MRSRGLRVRRGEDSASSAPAISSVLAWAGRFLVTAGTESKYQVSAPCQDRSIMRLGCQSWKDVGMFFVLWHGDSVEWRWR